MALWGRQSLTQSTCQSSWFSEPSGQRKRLEWCVREWQRPIRVQLRKVLISDDVPLIGRGDVCDPVVRFVRKRQRRICKVDYGGVAARS